jgi:hypothetical protein
MGQYERAFRRSLDDPEGFWGEAAALLRWRASAAWLSQGEKS